MLRFGMLVMLWVCICPVSYLIAQERHWTGRVMDGAGQPMAHVSVRVKGGPIERTTDSYGRYAIPDSVAVADSCVLVFSHVGKLTKTHTVYTTQLEVPAVAMKDHSLALGEINVSART